ncbi:hypothetical protein [Adlercreutzia caecimuris]|jgi:hypothetical protein|uniref:Uncharacterized protein n=1 Tax=Adlercreutzia caecimuris TaxID=671266 RepID=A0A4S4FYQ8_9ACTN|nr:hypothetical protein [Adlercreutzia caecimuris]MCR2038028.1 hypothetical protein [Adlercreutzia caecimuris]NBJ65692.1 hypothetical protein [Adlercreutzia caecimuris]THG35983.1 hypothetical protein E5986_10785 [Adlercreutzia caecimuris]
MNLSEKLPWLTWKNVHLVAVACIAVGFIILAVGMAIIGSIVAGLENPSWQAVVDLLSFPGMPSDTCGIPEAPTPPEPPTIS